MTFTRRFRGRIRPKGSKHASAEPGLIADLVRATRASREELPSIAQGTGISRIDLRRFVEQGKPLSLNDAERLSHYLGLRLEPCTKVVPAKAITLHKKGKTNAQVARALGISRRTVIRYRQRSATR